MATYARLLRERDAWKLLVWEMIIGLLPNKISNFNLKRHCSAYPPLLFVPLTSLSHDEEPTRSLSTCDSDVFFVRLGRPSKHRKLSAARSKAEFLPEQCLVLQWRCYFDRFFGTQTCPVVGRKAPGIRVPCSRDRQADINSCCDSTSLDIWGTSRSASFCPLPASILITYSPPRQDETRYAADRGYRKRDGSESHL